MDIGNTVTDLVGSIDWNLLLPLVQAMVVFFLMLWAKNYITSLHAWLNFKSSLNICLGVWVRLPTATGHVDGRVVNADRKRISIDTGETVIYVPTKTFGDRDWVLLKRDVAVPEQA